MGIGGESWSSAKDFGSELGNGPTKLKCGDQGAGAGRAFGGGGECEELEEGLHGVASAEGEEAFPRTGHFRPGIQGEGEAPGFGKVRDAITE